MQISGLSNWSYIEYLIAFILLLYFMRGCFRKTVKSIVSLILFPLAITGYIICTRILARSFLIPESISGITKVFLLSFLIVAAGRFLLYLLIPAFFKKEYNSTIKEIVARIPGIIASILEGVLFLVFIFWSADYFDNIIEQQYPEFSKNIYSNQLVNKVNILNPLYDIKGAKDFKIVFTALTLPGSSEKLFKHRIYKEFLEIPVVKKLINDQSLQKIIQDKSLIKLATNNLMREFLQDPSVFKFICSSDLIKACRSIIPKYHLKDIEERKGIFSDIHFGV